MYSFSYLAVYLAEECLRGVINLMFTWWITMYYGQYLQYISCQLRRCEAGWSPPSKRDHRLICILSATWARCRALRNLRFTWTLPTGYTGVLPEDVIVVTIRVLLAGWKTQSFLSVWFSGLSCMPGGSIGTTDRKLQWGTIWGEIPAAETVVFWVGGLA